MPRSDLMFGVEIETMMASEYDVYASEYLENEIHAPGWEFKEDGSLKSYESDEGYVLTGAEIASPVLPLDTDGLWEVWRMLQSLRMEGCECDSQCGFHLNIGYEGGPHELAKLASLYAIAHSVTSKMVSENRIGNNYCYCPPAGRDPIEAILQRARNEAQRLDASEADIMCGVLRVEPHDRGFYAPRLNRIEIRGLEGTLHPQTIFSWIKFHELMVRESLNPRPIDLETARMIREAGIAGALTLAGVLDEVPYHNHRTIKDFTLRKVISSNSNSFFPVPSISIRDELHKESK